MTFQTNRTCAKKWSNLEGAVLDKEKPHTLPNVVACSGIGRTNGGDRAGVGAIAVLLPVVLAADGWKERHDDLLFHELRAVHDDDFGHRGLVLPEPLLQRRAEFGTGVSSPAPLIYVSASHGPASPERRGDCDKQKEAPALQPGSLILSNQSCAVQFVTSSSWPAFCNNHRSRRCGCPNPTSHACCISVRL